MVFETPRSARRRLGEIVAAETDSGKKYLGAIVYRKVIAIAAGPNSSTVTTAHGITGLAIVLSQTGNLTSAGGTQVPLPYFHATAAAGIRIEVNATNVLLISGASGDYSLSSGFVILEYTKA